MRKEFLLIFFLALWGLPATWGQSPDELVGTASVVSSTGSDPTPTVTINFNSTVGFLPQNVDTGDVMLVRQVFSGNHRRKLYRITGIAPGVFSPLTLTLTLINGTSGGPFPAGTHEIFRRTEKGALLDVPNTSQELESYTYNYNTLHFEAADIDTTIERNDSIFIVLNDETEFYSGPSTATAIDTSYQVGDSVFVVSSGDTIFTGIAYNNDAIDTTYELNDSFYIVTVGNDTFFVGEASQVTANNAHPTNPATYLIHIDTLGVDTLYFNNDSLWVAFNVGSNSIGGPLFRTNNNFVSYFPAGNPPLGSFIMNADLGNFYRRQGPSQYISELESNGRNVRNADRWFETGDITTWRIGLHSACNLFFTNGVNGTISNPTDIDSPLTATSIGSQRTLALNNQTGSGRWAKFGNRFRVPSGLAQLDSIYVVENSVMTLDFNYDMHDNEFIMRLHTDPTAVNTTYTFSDSANGLDLAESSGTVTVAPDITELTFATVVGADSVWIWDSSANAHRRTSVADIVALASAGTVTVTDQVNGLDITLTGTDITIRPDFGEVANATVASADSVLVLDVSAGVYRRVSAGSIAALGTGLGTPWVLGGQTVGANANIGPIDAFRFGIGTGGSTRLYFSNDGRVFHPAGNITDWIVNATDSTKISGASIDLAGPVKITGTAIATGDVSVPSEAYGVGWNGSPEAPQKDAVYDKIEALSATVVVTGVDDQANGHDLSMSGTLVRSAPDINELTTVTLASGDFLMVADVSDSNNPKKVPASSFVIPGSTEYAAKLNQATDAAGVYHISHPFGATAIKYCNLIITETVAPYTVTVVSTPSGTVNFQVWNPTTGLPISLPNRDIYVLIKT